jgi:GDP-mannose pyrophosphatase NudK
MVKGNYRIISSEIMAKGWSSLSKLKVVGIRLDGRQVRGTCLLVRQWRAGAASTGHDGWLIEACAGLLDADDPAGCARREAFEELGTHVHNITHVCECFSSPGAVSERISLFMGTYSAADRAHEGGGLHHEDEDIEVLELPLKIAFAMIAKAEIQDAKTIILLQHAVLNHAKSR